MGRVHWERSQQLKAGLRPWEGCRAPQDAPPRKPRRGDRAHSPRGGSAEGTHPDTTPASPTQKRSRLDSLCSSPLRMGRHRDSAGGGGSGALPPRSVLPNSPQDFSSKETPGAFPLLPKAHRCFHSRNRVPEALTKQPPTKAAPTNLPGRDEAEALSAPGAPRAAPWAPPSWTLPRRTPTGGRRRRKGWGPGRADAPPPSPAAAVGAARDGMAVALRPGRQAALRVLRALGCAEAGGSGPPCCRGPLGGTRGLAPSRRGGMGPRGPSHLRGHHVGEIAAPRSLSGLEQTSVASRVCAAMTPGCRGHPRAWEPKDNRAGVLTLAPWCPLEGATWPHPAGVWCPAEFGSRVPAPQLTLGKSLSRFLRLYR